jgi:gas vesicle protein
MAESHSGGNGAFVTGLLLGGLVGALVGAWKAPRSGAELRQVLLARGGEARRQAEARMLGERPADAIAEGKAMAQQRQIELKLD